MKQYETTIGEVRDLGTDAVSADHPSPPRGAGWRMVGSTATGLTLLWFWEREVSTPMERAVGS